MEGITTAIIAALANLSHTAVQDSYNALKGAIKRKIGGQGDLSEAIEGLEKKPNSQGRQATLQEEIQAAKLQDDAEITAYAQALQQVLASLSKPQSAIQQSISHVKYAATSGTGDASINTISE